MTTGQNKIVNEKQRQVNRPGKGFFVKWRSNITK